MTTAFEINFDGLVGPTHNYSALSWGNVASMGSQGVIANPMAAALQGLDKMKRLRDLGIKQGVFPPLERPTLAPLRRLGFGQFITCGVEAAHEEAEIITKAADEAPELLAACFSASSMWAANSATVTPASDTADGRVHFTPANLISNFHRSLEADQMAAVLRKIFADERFFRVHDPLPRADPFADEGAANHSRFCAEHGDTGLHLFVFGRDGLRGNLAPRTFPARQTHQASEAICRQHGIDPNRVIFAQQNPATIDAGVFHNDVIATANRDIFFYHELAYVDTPRVINTLCEKFEVLTGRSLRLIEVTAQELPLEQVVASYLFNSQIITDSAGHAVLVAPKECERLPRVRAYLAGLQQCADCPFKSAVFVDVNQSMRNGGGPACLRLRVVLTDEQLQSIKAKVLLTDDLYNQLRECICAMYPKAVSQQNFRDPGFVQQCRAAVSCISEILELA
jgi:succinylarginine dihydrolase